MYAHDLPAHARDGMPVDTLSIAGFPVRATTAPDLATELLIALREGRRTTLFFANTNFVVKCRPLLAQMFDPSIVIANDGIGLDLAAKMLHGQRFPANLNGTDFTPYLCSQSPHPLRIFLVGAQPRVLAKAEDHARNKLGQQVVGTCDGYAGMADPYLIERINAAQPDLILVALGNPVQEQWILENRMQLNAGIVMGVGALFDFWAGEKPRAPKFVQKMRMEWFYRLSLEPKRLMRRYTFDILVFFRVCYRYRNAQGSK